MRGAGPWSGMPLDYTTGRTYGTCADCVQCGSATCAQPCKGRTTVRTRASLLQGAWITNYLLERTRITSPSEGERNFHVLYQLLAADREALPDRLRTQLGDLQPRGLGYLSAGDN